MISEKQIEKIDKVIQGFGFGLIQDTITVLDLISHHNILIKELQEYVYLRKKRGIEESRKEEVEFLDRQERENKLWESVAPKCPDCGEKLIKPRKLCGKEKASNKEGWSCQWLCVKGWEKDEPSGICGWEKYTHENALEIVESLVGGKLDGYNFS